MEVEGYRAVEAGNCPADCRRLPSKSQFHPQDRGMRRVECRPYRLMVAAMTSVTKENTKDGTMET
jgi:hypothetical protein